MAAAERVPTEAITAERLTGWAKALAEFHATPALLLGIGHDEHRGQLVVCVPDDDRFNRRTLRGLLRRALAELDS
jgi:hypothetical protein